MTREDVCSVQGGHHAAHRSVRAATALLAGGFVCFACSAEPLVVLGDREPARFVFEPPELLTELAAPAKTDNPSLTADMLEIFFTSERDGIPADLYVAERAARGEPFGAVQRLTALSSPGVETTPAVSADGLTLWFASDRLGGLGDLDIWVATRGTRDGDWSEPDNVAALNSSAKEIPRPPGQRARVMPMSSDRDSPNYYQIYFATRAGPSQPFAAIEHVAELSFADESTVDGFLSNDGLTLFYVTGPPFGPADLYVASRRSTSDSFEHVVPLEELNSPSDERDPWLSPDGTELYFSSDRSGVYAIYVASVHQEPAEITP
jgi:hypothetical protein